MSDNRARDAEGMDEHVRQVLTRFKAATPEQRRKLSAMITPPSQQYDWLTPDGLTPGWCTDVEAF